MLSIGEPLGCVCHDNDNKIITKENTDREQGPQFKQTEKSYTEWLWRSHDSSHATERSEEQLKERRGKAQ